MSTTRIPTQSFWTRFLGLALCTPLLLTGLPAQALSAGEEETSSSESSPSAQGEVVQDSGITGITDAHEEQHWRYGLGGWQTIPPGPPPAPEPAPETGSPQDTALL